MLTILFNQFVRPLVTGSNKSRKQRSEPHRDDRKPLHEFRMRDENEVAQIISMITPLL